MAVEGSKLSIMLLGSDLVALTELNQHCLFVPDASASGESDPNRLCHSLSCLGQGKPCDAGTSYLDLRLLVRKVINLTSTKKNQSDID